MRILFISHSFPPVIGGVEKQNYDLSENLRKTAQITVIANRRGKKWLPVFLPVAFLQALWLMHRHDSCLLGNGVLAPIGSVLKLFYSDKQFGCIIHGLDITYGHRTGPGPAIYRRINIPGLQALDRLIAVSRATLEEAVQMGARRERCVAIPNGVTVDDLRERHSRDELSALFGQDVTHRQVILRLARFVPHKGTSWFIENVMPRLSDDTVLIAAGSRVAGNTAGDRDDFSRCEQAIADNRLEGRVQLLAALPWESVKVLLNTVDLVVSPNIRVPGSMEGFGLNVIEAAACERVVIASNIEGLTDAVEAGENGFLVEAGNVEQWVAKTASVLQAGEDFRARFGRQASRFVVEKFSWDKICCQYLSALEAT
jgi:glycosyltransferase involved in cell wall biosynthesis